MYLDTGIRLHLSSVSGVTTSRKEANPRGRIRCLLAMSVNILNKYGKYKSMNKYCHHSYSVAELMTLPFLARMCPNNWSN